MHARVIDLYSVKPVDGETLRAAAEATGGRFVIVEDHWPEGGLGEAVLSAFADVGRAAARSCSSPFGEMPGSGTPAELLAAAGHRRRAHRNRGSRTRPSAVGASS